MNRKFHTNLISIIFLVSMSTAYASEYTVEMIPIQDGSSASPTGISDSGIVVGIGLSSCYKYENGNLSYLPKPEGSGSCYRATISPKGDVSITVSGKSGYYESYDVLADGTFQPLTGISNVSNIVRGSSRSLRAGSSSGSAYVFNTQGPGVDVGINLPGPSYLTAINQNGIAVGEYRDETSGNTRGFKYENGSISFLGDLKGYEYGTTPWAINRRGTVVGDAIAKQSNSGVKWRVSTKARDAYSFPVDVSSKARGINNQGIIIGSAEIGMPTATRSFRGKTEKLIDLISRADAEKWDLMEANAINAKGQIVGLGRFNGTWAAFLLHPVEQNASN
jgi:probable HAF family extracellular repeat protein